MADIEDYAADVASSNGAQNSKAELKFKTAANQLKSLRRRLLDTSGRTRYISFTHSETSRTQVRFVDAPFTATYDAFASTAELAPRPLRDVSAATLGEDAFVSDDRDAGDSARRFRRARVLKPDLIAEHARSQGIDPDYELRRVRSKGSDRSLQTLLFKDGLDRKLSGIFDENRRYQQELGVNALFTCFGFLEWYEAEHSNKARFAPLLIVPTEIRRKVFAGRYEYRFAGAGDDPDINIALAERLRSDFGIELPSYGEDDDALGYLSRVENLVRELPRWCVHGFITASILNFSKVAMYNDLDPDASGFEAPVAEHPVVADILGGSDDPFEDAQPSADQLDELNIQEAPLLVTDADFSQYAAVLRALDKRSLVIEGPPGTGKSQTITNILAAALARGDSVLFLAEKLAALQIVKDKLDHFGLGDFVLELHSTKSKKADVLASIDRRLRLQKLGDAVLDTSRQTAERDEINAYLDALHEEVGALQLSLHDAIWKEIRLRGQVQQHVTVLDQLEIRDAEAVSPRHMVQVKRLCDAYEELTRGVTEAHGSLIGHPWHGLSLKDGSPEGRRNLVRMLNETKQRLASLVDAVRSHCSSLDLVQPEVVDEVDSYLGFVSLVGKLEMNSSLSDALDERARTALIQPSASPDLERFLGNIEDFTATETRWGKDLLDRVTGDLDSFVKAADEALELSEATTTVSSLRINAEVFESRAQHLMQLHGRLSEAARELQLDSLLDAEVLNALHVAANTAHEFPEYAHIHWCPDLREPDHRAIATEAMERGRNVAARYSALTARLDFKANEDPVYFRALGRSLKAAGVFWFLSGDIRKARTEFRARARTLGSRSNLEMGNEFIELADVLEERTAYGNDADAAAVFGKHFRGIDSDFSAMAAALDWAAATIANLTGQGRAGALIVPRLFQASLDQLQTISNLARDRIYETAMTAITDADSADRLRELSATAQRDAVRLRNASTTFTEIGIDSSCSVSTVRDMSRDARIYQDLRLTLEGDGIARTLLGRRFRGSATPIEDVRSLAEFATALRRSNLADNMRRRVTAIAPHHLIAQSKQLLAAAGQTQRSRSIIEEAQSTGLLDRCAGSIDRIESTLHTAIQRTDLLDEWFKVQGLRQQLCDASGEEFVQAFDTSLGSMTPIPLATAYEYLVTRTAVVRAINSQPVLQRMTGLTIDAARARFAELDKKFLSLSQLKLRNVLMVRRVDRGNGTGPKSSYTGLSLVRSELTKIKRHIPIRELVRRSGLTLQQLKPCWMMSPLSVAQFIEGHSVKFDLIVIDEASQMRPEDAIGAIARGGRVIVVGDQKQLPPTAFFDRALEPTDEEIEDGDAVDAESILDETLRKFGAPRQLRVHYRSNFESLIAFSNHYFYDGNLLIYPSPATASGEGGVRSHFVGGLYKSSLNAEEANAIIDAALSFMRVSPNLSAGIVTINYEQREYINEELERRIAQDPLAAEYVAKWEPTLYPFFVKNLESVQGDERDVIFISTVYGPETVGGKVAQRFGPILGPAGWRRLNVLFTRARHRVELFTSMKPSDIPIGEGMGRGVKALRDYLEYAETGRLETGVGCRQDPQSDFELAVARALTNRGFHVDYQIGVAHCFIDLGVRNPRTGTYILGVECDGATYHRSRYARERDRIREEKLRALGWNLYRIWSTDWFNNPEHETDQLVELLQELFKESDLA